MIQKKWTILSKKTVTLDTLVDVLLENRGITKEEKGSFLSPDIHEISFQTVGIDTTEVEKAKKRLDAAISNKEQIIVYGDYDVDGVTASAILWETLHDAKAKVMPYIPHRIEEGYGLSIAGIDNLLLEYPETKIIITVDNGIVAHQAIEYANTKSIEVIITDHHQKSSTIPQAYAIVHTDKLCGAGISWLFSNLIRDSYHLPHLDDHLVFAALGTIADLVPLIGGNRAIVKEGLKLLNTTNRPGLTALFQEAALTQGSIGVYEVGHVIAPRLNAMGRLESAMDSLRLLCLKDQKRAWHLAQLLGTTNRSRQLLTLESTQHASAKVKELGKDKKKILFIGDSSYQPGVIGLIAGKLVEEYYRPAIVLSLDVQHAKASVRSVSGVNIIELLRRHESEFVNIGGHPMAAGFTIETEKFSQLEKLIEDLADELITDDQLIKTLRVDAKLTLDQIDTDLYEQTQKLAPYGMGNPEPTFVSENVEIEDIQLMGKDKKHLKLSLLHPLGNLTAVGFGMGEYITKLEIGKTVDLLYTVDINEWNGRRNLQLKIKDIQG
jgi:single-stranded-DNA-specific exonuclease